MKVLHSVLPSVPPFLCSGSGKTLDAAERYGASARGASRPLQALVGRRPIRVDICMQFSPLPRLRQFYPERLNKTRSSEDASTEAFERASKVGQQHQFEAGRIAEAPSLVESRPVAPGGTRLACPPSAYRLRSQVTGSMFRTANVTMDDEHSAFIGMCNNGNRMAEMRAQDLGAVDAIALTSAAVDEDYV